MAPPQPPINVRQCYLTVEVKDTDYNTADEFIVSTTANGVEVHGKCKPGEDGVTVDARGFFTCAKMVELPRSPDSTYSFVTTATDAVDENAYEGSYVHVEYMVDCDGSCQPPSANSIIKWVRHGRGSAPRSPPSNTVSMTADDRFSSDENGKRFRTRSAGRGASCRAAAPPTRIGRSLTALPS